jgi:hypothetical protein
MSNKEKCGSAKEGAILMEGGREDIDLILFCVALLCLRFMVLLEKSRSFLPSTFPLSLLCSLVLNGNVLRK